MSRSRVTALLEDHVADFVAEHPGCTAREIAKGVHRGYGSVYEVLSRRTFERVAIEGSRRFGYRLRDVSPVQRDVRRGETSGDAGSGSSQCARILAVLADGLPHTVAEIHQRCGFSRLNSRIAELRPRVAREGLAIECRHNGDPRGGSHAYEYVLLSTRTAAA